MFATFLIKNYDREKVKAKHNGNLPPFITNKNNGLLWV